MALLIQKSDSGAVRIIESQNHRMIECLGLEGTYRRHLAQPPLAVSRDILHNPTRLDLGNPPTARGLG